MGKTAGKGDLPMAEDNYGKLVEEWRQRFLTTDVPERAAALGLEVRDGEIPIRYFNRDYILRVSDGAIRRREGAAPIPRYDAMFLYHLFWFSNPHPRASGVLVPFREVKGAAIFEPAFRKLAILPLSRGFSGRAAELAAACLALGGTSLGKGDVGYRIPVFAGLDVAVLFWDGDEEFDASANILFDKNFTDFTHVETVVTVGVDAAESLLNLAGIPHESSYK